MVIYRYLYIAEKWTDLDLRMYIVNVVVSRWDNVTINRGEM